ncbi:equilibrative nucleoside transporter [Pelomyxa schiedti]|nr:equilibrative nucleoside transporter [Pelomyxa schiedti]
MHRDPSGEEEPAEAKHVREQDGGEDRKRSWVLLSIFLLLGTGILLPWNAYATAYDYWDHFYPDSNFEFFLGIVYNYPNVITTLSAIWLAPKLPFGPRLFFGFGIFLIALIGIPIITQFIDASVSLYINLGFVALSGVATGILFPTVTALGAMFPGNNITAIMVGNGIAGVLVCAIRIITKATTTGQTNSYAISGSLYFSLSAFVILLCIVACIVLLRMNITKVVLSNFVLRAKNINTQETVPLVSGGANRSKPKLSAVFRKSLSCAAMIFTVFFVTLAVFPGVTTLIPSSNDNLGDWFPVIMITVFCVGDFIGRSLPYIFRVHRYILAVLSYSRVVFLVMFIICALGYLVYNALSYVLMALMAVSNGYCGTLSLMYGPDAVEAHERELAAIVVTFSMQFGIFTACNFAMLLLYLITGSVFG